MSMFYEVAFLIVTPLVISIAKEADIPYMRLIIPAVSGTTMGLFFRRSLVLWRW